MSYNIIHILYKLNETTGIKLQKRRRALGDNKSNMND